VALSLLLLIVAGLFVHSFQKLTRVNLGYDRDRLLQFEVAPEPGIYRSADEARTAATQLHQQLLERIKSIPGVAGASLSFNGLFNTSFLGADISIEDYNPEPGRSMGVQDDLVGPNYFSTAGIPILMGREIGPQDEGHGPRVGVINQTMAQTYFG